ncbi:hypothetical protein [Pyxidicoccus trucidator]|nr:hypothetical protein [Pyxidicoccus trucidator]
MDSAQVAALMLGIFQGPPDRQTGGYRLVDTEAASTQSDADTKSR